MTDTQNTLSTGEDIPSVEEVKAFLVMHFGEIDECGYEQDFDAEINLIRAFSEKESYRRTYWNKDAVDDSIDKIRRSWQTIVREFVSLPPTVKAKMEGKLADILEFNSEVPTMKSSGINYHTKTFENHLNRLDAAFNEPTVTHKIDGSQLKSKDVFTFAQESNLPEEDIKEKQSGTRQNNITLVSIARDIWRDYKTPKDFDPEIGPDGYPTKIWQPPISFQQHTFGVDHHPDDSEFTRYFKDFHALTRCAQSPVSVLNAWKKNEDSQLSEK